MCLSLKIVKKYGPDLENLPDHFKKDKKIVLNAVKEFGFSIEYADDSLKKDKKNRDGVVRKKQSVKEQMFEAIIKHQNSGGKTGYYNIFTLSDKTVTPVLHIDKYKLNDKTQGRTAKDLIFKQSADIKETFDFGETFKTELYNLVESEINRIVDYSKQLKAGNKLKQANFDKALLGAMPTLMGMPVQVNTFSRMLTP